MIEAEEIWKQMYFTKRDEYDEVYKRLAEHYPKDTPPHFCTEWDYLFICPGDVEWEACLCHRRYDEGY